MAIEDITDAKQHDEYAQPLELQASLSRLDARQYHGFEAYILKNAGMERKAELYAGSCSSMDKILEGVRMKQIQLAIDQALEICRRA